MCGTIKRNVHSVSFCSSFLFISNPNSIVCFREIVFICSFFSLDLIRLNVIWMECLCPVEACHVGIEIMMSSLVSLWLHVALNVPIEHISEHFICQCQAWSPADPSCLFSEKLSAALHTVVHCYHTVAAQPIRMNPLLFLHSSSATPSFTNEKHRNSSLSFSSHTG